MNEKEILQQNLTMQLSENTGCREPMAALCLLIGLFIIASCCTCRKVVSDNNSSSVQQDSTYVEHKTNTETIYIRDTTYILVPAQEKERQTSDSTSHLETDLAESDAKIMPDGSLYHSLKNKDNEIPVAFDKPQTTIHDTLYIYESHEKEDVSENNTTNEVERDYTWWDKTRFIKKLICMLFS